MRAVRATGRLLSAALTAVLAFILLCNLYLIGVRNVTGERQPTVFGWSTAVVISGSMSGAIEVNDMIFVRAQDQYYVGDIISFDTGSSIVTHRIVSEAADGFITKGDANNAADTQPVKQEQIIGRVAFVVPHVGAIIEYMRTPLGMLCIVLLGFVLIQLSSLLERASYKNE